MRSPGRRQAHAVDAGIELRVLLYLQHLRAAVITSTVGSSGIRLRHAVPRPDRSAVTR